MTREEINRAVAAAVAQVAPDADMSHLDADANFRDALDLDSIDFLNVVVAWKARLGVEVPEDDYPRVQTLRAAADYLASRLAA